MTLLPPSPPSPSLPLIPGKQLPLLILAPCVAAHTAVAVLVSGCCITSRTAQPTAALWALCSQASRSVGESGLAGASHRSEVSSGPGDSSVWGWAGCGLIEVTPLCPPAGSPASLVMWGPSRPQLAGYCVPHSMPTTPCGPKQGTRRAPLKATRTLIRFHKGGAQVRAPTPHSCGPQPAASQWPQGPPA